MFPIKIHAREKLVELDVKAFMTVADAEDLFSAWNAEMAKTGWQAGDFVLLIDGGATVQPLDTVARIVELARETPFRARRVASFREGQITRIQSQRMAQQANPDQEVGVFGSIEDARAWLLESQVRSAA